MTRVFWAMSISFGISDWPHDSADFFPDGCGKQVELSRSGWGVTTTASAIMPMAALKSALHGNEHQE